MWRGSITLDLQWAISLFKFARQTLYPGRRFLLSFFLFFFFKSVHLSRCKIKPQHIYVKICITRNMRFINYEALNEKKAVKNRRLHTAFSIRNQRHALFLSLSHMCSTVFGELCACASHTRYCAGAFSRARESVVAGLRSEMLLCSPRVPLLWKKRSPSWHSACVR